MDRAMKHACYNCSEKVYRTRETQRLIRWLISYSNFIFPSVQKWRVHCHDGQLVDNQTYRPLLRPWRRRNPWTCCFVCCDFSIDASTQHLNAKKMWGLHFSKNTHHITAEHSVGSAIPYCAPDYLAVIAGGKSFPIAVNSHQLYIWGDKI